MIDVCRLSIPALFPNLQPYPLQRPLAEATYLLYSPASMKHTNTHRSNPPPNADADPTQQKENAT